MHYYSCQSCTQGVNELSGISCLQATAVKRRQAVMPQWNVLLHMWDFWRWATSTRLQLAKSCSFWFGNSCLLTYMIAPHEVADSHKASQLGRGGWKLHNNNSSSSNINKTNLTFIRWLMLLAIKFPSVLSWASNSGSWNLNGATIHHHKPTPSCNSQLQVCFRSSVWSNCGTMSDFLATVDVWRTDHCWNNIGLCCLSCFTLSTNNDTNLW